MEDTQPQTLATAALTLLLSITVAKVLKNLIFRSRDSLSVVGDSSRLIAAWRAVESLESEESRLFYDPLAFILAGDRHVKQCLKKAKRVLGQHLLKTNHRFFQISLNGIRVWWFDQQILAALKGSLPSKISEGNGYMYIHSLTSRLKHVVTAPFTARPIRQVIVIGSGMDTRPWRLSLPAGVKWFEIDRTEVLAAKNSALKKAGAAFEHKPSSSSKGSKKVAEYPLQAASWTAVAVDVGSPGWCESLIQAGYDPRLPVVWVLEGLLMYLTQPASDAVLKEAADNSAPGSVLLGHTCSMELIEMIQRDGREVSYPPFTSELIVTWTSGLPLNPKEELKNVGWTLKSAATRAQIAREAVFVNNSRVLESKNNEDQDKEEEFEEDLRGRCDFETAVEQGRDRFAVFFAAVKE